MFGNTTEFPRKVISDQGPQSIATFMRELYQLLGIELGASTVYHPHTNGQTELVNQELEQYLQLFVNREMHGYSHGFRGFLSVRHVVQNQMNFLQFFSWKSVEN